jgi:hypothetical protein
VLGSGGVAPCILNDGYWGVPRIGRFTSGERDHIRHWIGGWLGPGSGHNAVGKDL